MCARAGFVEGVSWAHEQCVAVASSGATARESRGSLPASGRHPGQHRRSSVRAAERRQPRRLRSGRQRLHASAHRGFATRGVRDRLFRASVQPCTRSGGRLGSAGRDFGLGPRSAASSEAPLVRVTTRTRREAHHRWVCSGFVSIAEVGEQCPAQEHRCGRGRSEATAPSLGQGNPGFAAKGTVAETPKRFRRRLRTLVTDGRCSFVRVARVHRSRGVLGQSAWGSRGNRRRKAGLLETRERQRLAGSAQHRKRKPEQRALQRVEVGEAT